MIPVTFSSRLVIAGSSSGIGEGERGVSSIRSNLVRISDSISLRRSMIPSVLRSVVSLTMESETILFTRVGTLSTLRASASSSERISLSSKNALLDKSDSCRFADSSSLSTIDWRKWGRKSSKLIKPVPKRQVAICQCPRVPSSFNTTEANKQITTKIKAAAP